MTWRKPSREAFACRRPERPRGERLGAWRWIHLWRTWYLVPTWATVTDIRHYTDVDIHILSKKCEIKWHFHNKWCDMFLDVDLEITSASWIASARSSCLSYAFTLTFGSFWGFCGLDVRLLGVAFCQEDDTIKQWRRIWNLQSTSPITEWAAERFPGSNDPQSKAVSFGVMVKNNEKHANMAIEHYWAYGWKHQEYLKHRLDSYRPPF